MGNTSLSRGRMFAYVPVNTPEKWTSTAKIFDARGFNLYNQLYIKMQIDKKVAFLCGLCLQKTKYPRQWAKNKECVYGFSNWY